MKTYSRWNWRTLRYDYFRGPGEENWGFGAAPRSGIVMPSAPPSPIGYNIEDALRPLPSGSVQAGSGDAPKGELVRPLGLIKKATLADVILPISVITFGGYGIWWLWKTFAHRRRRR